MVSHSRHKSPPLPRPWVNSPTKPRLLRAGRNSPHCRTAKQRKLHLRRLSYTSHSGRRWGSGKATHK